MQPVGTVLVLPVQWFNFCLFSATVSLLVRGSISFLPVADGFTECDCSEAPGDPDVAMHTLNDDVSLWRYPEVDLGDSCSTALTQEVLPEGSELRYTIVLILVYRFLMGLTPHHYSNCRSMMFKHSCRRKSLLQPLFRG